MTVLISSDVLRDVYDCLAFGQDVRSFRSEDLDLGQRHRVESLTTWLEALLLYDSLVVQTHGLETLVARAANHVVGEEFITVMHDYAEPSLRASYASEKELSALRSMLVPDVPISEAYPGEGVGPVIALICDVEYFLPRLLDRYGYPRIYDADELEPGRWTLHRLFNFLRERSISAAEGISYVPCSPIVEHYGSVFSSQFLYAGALANDLCEFFDREVVERIREKVRSVLPSALSSGLQMPLISRMILKESREVPVMETVRQLRSSRELEDFRSYLAKLEDLGDSTGAGALQREVSSLQELAARWCTSLSGPESTTKSIRVSLLFASAEIPLKDRSLKRWVPRNLAFIHKAILSELSL